MRRMKVDIYCRVSSEDQNVEQQLKHLRKWVKDNNHIISSETVDKQSGKVDLKERFEFIRLLNFPKGDGMLILNLDRLTRNWDSVTFIEKHFRDNWQDYKLISTADDINLSSASGRLMFRIKLAISCYMPEDMLEKQKIGIARAIEEGKFKGRKIGSKNKINNTNL